MISPFESVAYRITSRYGMRTVGGVTAMHNGIDLVNAGGGRRLVATADGVVTNVVRHIPDTHTGLNVTANTAGNLVFIRTTEGYFVKYMHLKHNSTPAAFKIGSRVSEGDFVGEMGSTGRSSAPHLHYQLEDQAGKPFDPEGYIGNNMTITGKRILSSAVMDNIFINAIENGNQKRFKADRVFIEPGTNFIAARPLAEALGFVVSLNRSGEIVFER